MNLLPFVIVVIVILGLFAQSFLGSHITKAQEVKVYKSYFQGMRELRNQKEDQAYQAGLSSKERAALENNGDFVYFREQWEGAPIGRINLSSLLSDTPNNTLYRVVLVYFERIYGKTLFRERKDKKAFKTILDEIIKIQKKRLKEHKDNLLLYEIVFEAPHLKKIYYKMLKGTNSYNLTKKEGYLPLCRIVEFSESFAPPINFNYANIALVEALFGEKSSSMK